MAFFMATPASFPFGTDTNLPVVMAFSMDTHLAFCSASMDSESFSSCAAMIRINCSNSLGCSSFDLVPNGLMRGSVKTESILVCTKHEIRPFSVCSLAMDCLAASRPLSTGSGRDSIRSRRSGLVATREDSGRVVGILPGSLRATLGLAMSVGSVPTGEINSAGGAPPRQHTHQVTKSRATLANPMCEARICR